MNKADQKDMVQELCKAKSMIYGAIRALDKNEKREKDADKLTESVDLIEEVIKKYG